MSAQSIKLKLKEAKEALNAGEMKSAIIACKVRRNWQLSEAGW